MRRILVFAITSILVSSCTGLGGGPRTDFGLNGEGVSRRLGQMKQIKPNYFQISRDASDDPDRLNWNTPNQPLINPTATTTAVIVRGGQSIPIDFATDDAIRKIKSGDIVQLEAGRYNSLPLDLVNKVTFRGVPGQTAIGSFPSWSNKEWKPLQSVTTNENYFYDIYFAAKKFTFNGNRAYFFGCRFEDITSMSAVNNADRLPRMIVAFSHLGHRKLTYRDEFREITYMVGYLAFDSLLQRDFGEHGASTEVITGEEFIKGPQSTALIKDLSERHLRDYVAKKSPVNATIAAEIQKTQVAAINEATIADKSANSYSKKTKEMQKAFYPEAMRYLAYKTDYKPEFNKDKVEQIITLAERELKNSNYLIAYAMMRNASQKYGASQHAPARAVLERAEKAVGNGYACNIEGSYTPLLRSWALLNLPILNASVPNSGCKIKIENIGSPETTSESVTAITKSVHYEEYDPMIRYKEMMRAAAAKEQEKAFAAGLNASVERMKDSARKLYEGRVRREGDYLVYGQGNFGGQASAGTLSAQRTAQDNAQSYQAAANAANQKGMAIKEVNVKNETFYINYTYSFGVFAMITKPGEPSRKLDGGVRTAQWSRGPCQRNDLNNFEKGKATTNCMINGSLIGTPHGGNMSSSYEKTIVQPFFAGFVAESIVPNVVKKIAQSKQSKDAGTRLESLLLTHYTNLGSIDNAEVTKLAQEVTGEDFTLESFTDHLGIN